MPSCFSTAELMNDDHIYIVKSFLNVCRNTRFADRIDYGVQIQLRFCVVDSSAKQPDCFPSSVGVKVNNMMAQLPVCCHFMV
jgi:hypothetical protein